MIAKQKQNIRSISPSASFSSLTSCVDKPASHIEKSCPSDEGGSCFTTLISGEGSSGGEFLLDFEFSDVPVLRLLLCFRGGGMLSCLIKAGGILGMERGDWTSRGPCNDKGVSGTTMTPGSRVGDSRTVTPFDMIGYIIDKSVKK